VDGLPFDSPQRVDDETIDGAVDVLLEQDPGAFLSTLGDDGFVVPMPEGFPLADRLVTWRNDRTIMVDVVVPNDALTVVATWERCRREGIACGTVRLASDPDKVLTLTLVDTRHRFGVWLAVFSHDASLKGVTAFVPDERAIAPLRPRTVTMTKSVTAMITAIDENVTKLLGWPAEMIVGGRSSDFVHPDDVDRAVETWVQMLANQVGQRARFRHRCLDGSWLWVEVDNEYRHADDPDDIVVLAHMTDISAEMAAHDALEQRERLFRRLAESLPVALFQVQADRTVTYANDRVREVLGIGPQETLWAQLETVVDDDRELVRHALDEVLDGGADRELEFRIRQPRSGEERLCTMSLVALATDGSLPGAIVTINDITAAARLREELRIMATYDPLTGCLTRRAFVEQLDELLAGPDRDQVGLVFIDLDEFKPVNDRLGHGAGDELLRHAARAIRAAVRDGDFVGRFGGDEFLIACRGIAESDDALAVAERVRASLQGPVTLAAGTVDLKASIGIARVDDVTTRDTLVARADAAMYRSKRDGAGEPVLHGQRVNTAGSPAGARPMGHDSPA
jgi:diguanylate cyclase (GGDEF)-like protein/PAS domain S-box-containing protein